MYGHDEFLFNTAGTAVGTVLRIFIGSRLFGLQNNLLSDITDKKK